MATLIEKSGSRSRSRSPNISARAKDSASAVPLTDVKGSPMLQNYHTMAASQRDILHSMIPTVIEHLKKRVAALKERSFDERSQESDAIVFLDIAASDGANSIAMYKALQAEYNNITIGLHDLPNNAFLGARHFVSQEFSTLFLPVVSPETQKKLFDASESDKEQAYIKSSEELDLGRIHAEHHKGQDGKSGKTKS